MLFSLVGTTLAVSSGTPFFLADPLLIQQRRRIIINNEASSSTMN